MLMRGIKMALLLESNGLQQQMSEHVNGVHHNTERYSLWTSLSLIKGMSSKDHEEEY